ncbi:JmjC domain-containing protein [Legionella hackeliae]|uniref:Cupin superfamily protein n=1 Tax=Legionella hackeliae TaxID=449 RepID=A0A0A8UUR4_LEGHA|nr:cupin domain-containing protein [Legionella hackeliae]KTD13823.1 cupin [Legionella hackeliae]CEK10524.1 Cupin superfamily protein [Legionella hackeliae]STX47261.1 cupin [Legionella hackeliae]
MFNFNNLSVNTFLQDYWQKKPLVIRKALPTLVNPLSPDELAGLALEEEVESRIVFETPGKAPCWHLKRGPFSAKDFKKLPETHWTLLVQAVDRFVPEVALMLNYFDFIPQWRVDDIMISYAVEQGSVGPHYDNYDVFLYQAIGSRKWSLTTKNCHKENRLHGIELRIMNDFQTEEEYILEEGDMLYLPSHVGHYGIAVSKECMTYSFGYRSYQAQEMWDSFGEHLAEHKQADSLYKDPDWTTIDATSELPPRAWKNAKELMEQLLKDESQLKSWFGCFATQLDQHAEELMPEPLSEEVSLDDFMNELNEAQGIMRNPLCRFAYQDEEPGILHLFINGHKWNVEGISNTLIKLIANSRTLSTEELQSFLRNKNDNYFLFELWKLQWLEMIGP